MSLIYVFLTVIFTVYGQLVLKWQISAAGALPELFSDKLVFLLKQLLNPWVATGFAAAFLASLCWMAALTKLQLSYAYPLVSLSFILVLIFSNIFFYEPITIQKIFGTILIITGIAVSSYVRG